jgi:hypothetical protein
MQPHQPSRAIPAILKSRHRPNNPFCCRVPESRDKTSIRPTASRCRRIAEASGDPGAKTTLLKTAILEQGIAVEYVDERDGALGTSSGGCIRLLNGLSPAMEFTTLVHEHAHLCSPIGYVWCGW